jgi:predicted alpha/beta superfamily hydrolase
VIPPDLSHLAILAVLLVAACTRATAPAPRPAPPPVAGPAPLIVGETFRLDSRILAEPRVINVYLPPGYRRGREHYPVLYMPDGGIAEDFLHVMGTVDVSIRNQVVRPMIIIGIENTERRRDLTGPTDVAEDRKIAPRVGGAERFRQFLGAELKPYVAAHYRVAAQSAIIGESLAGLFVIETLLLQPGLFDSYIAIDPSVWWNAQALVRGAAARFAAWSAGPKQLYVATAGDGTSKEGVATLTAALEAAQPRGLVWHAEAMPDERHATIYPVAAIRALRLLFAATTPH